MEYITILFLAIGLSFDTFAVSITCGLVKTNLQFRQAIKIAFIMAFFQALMPIVGWLIASSINNYIEKYDHWIAAILLTILGIKMILESFKKEEHKNFDPLNLKVNITLALATSIDALFVGFTFALFHSRVIMPVIIIGAVTFIVAMLGMLFGKKIGAAFGKKLEILGGIILIIIAVKILFSHL